MKAKIISVVIPMYNSGNKTIRAIDSVLNQDYKECNFEILVVDDGSKDNSLQKVKDYKETKKITNLTIVHKENGGPATARNVGLRAATGEYLCLLDSDDEWLPNKISRQMQILKANSEIDFLGCNLVGRKVKFLGKEIKKLHKITVLQLLIKCFPQTSTAIFKRNILADVGYFDERDVMKYGEDGFYWLKICAKKNFFFFPDELVIYDDGKHPYVNQGWGSNVKEMRKGEQKTLKYAYKNKLINVFQFYCLDIFQTIKYMRRVIIVRIHKK
ncbi:hypothetical protein FACS189467_5540 [Bacteroidia bacterium]|nr:hypothetical protein FACS189467_5540 [Bacteroidia bacterium]